MQQAGMSSREADLRREFPTIGKLKQECTDRGYGQRRSIPGGFSKLKKEDYDKLIAAVLCCEEREGLPNGSMPQQHHRQQRPIPGATPPANNQVDKFWKKDLTAVQLKQLCKEYLQGKVKGLDKLRALAINRLLVSRLASEQKILPEDWNDLDLLMAISPYTDKSGTYVSKDILLSEMSSFGLSAKSGATKPVLVKALIGHHLQAEAKSEGSARPSLASLSRDQESLRRRVFETMFVANPDGEPLSRILAPARVVQEAKSFLQWAKLDTVIASDSIVSTEILTSRVKWLEEMHMTFKKLQEDLDGECRKDYEPLRQYMSAAKKQAELEIMNIRDCPDMFRHVEHHHTDASFPVYRGAAVIPDEGAEDDVTSHDKAGPLPRGQGRSYRKDAYFVSPPNLCLGNDGPLRKPQQQAIAAAKKFHAGLDSGNFQGNILEEEKKFIQELRTRAFAAIRVTYFQEYSEGFETVLMKELNRIVMGIDEVVQARELVMAGTGTSEASHLVLPTGLGKTGVICSLPFVLPLKNSRRILVVAPNLTIAGGASSSTASQEDAGRDRKSLIEGLMKDLGDPEENFYKHSFPGKRSLLPMDAELPVVMSLKDQSSGRAHSVEQLRDADIVVTNYQQLPNKKLEVFPKDFFDAIIVDEAHHCEAQSYKLIMDYFRGAHAVLLTATPFRSDRQELMSTETHKTSIVECIESKFIKDIAYCPVPVYSFDVVNMNDPLGAADTKKGWEHVQEAGGYRNIQEAALSSPNVRESIMQATMDCLRWLRKQSNYKHQAIVQAANIDDARELCMDWMKMQNSYPQNKGEFRIDFIASEDPALVGQEQIWHNPTKEVKKQLYEGKLDIIVHIGMLGEGFDHKPLSVAAIFRPFRSIGSFNQFVGRAVRRDTCNPSNKPQEQVAYVISHPALGIKDAWNVFCEERQDEKNELKGIGAKSDLPLQIQNQKSLPSIFEQGDTAARVISGELPNGQDGRMFMFRQHKSTPSRHAKGKSPAKAPVTPPPRQPSAPKMASPASSSSSSASTAFYPNGGLHYSDEDEVQSSMTFVTPAGRRINHTASPARTAGVNRKAD